MPELCLLTNLTSSEWASWVQALGSIVAIGASVWVVNRQHKNDVRLQALNQKDEALKRGEVVLELLKATSNQVKYTRKQFPDFASVFAVSSGQLYFDRTTLQQIDEPLAAVQLHQLDSPFFVSQLLAFRATIRQFRDNIENAIVSPHALQFHRFSAFAEALATLEKISIEIVDEVDKKVAELRG